MNYPHPDVTTARSQAISPPPIPYPDTANPSLPAITGADEAASPGMIPTGPEKLLDHGDDYHYPTHWGINE